MRKFILLIFLFVIASEAKQSFAQTNVYHPFPDSNAVWFSWKSWCPCPPYVGIQLEIWDWLIGDTIIGSSTYKKIEEYTYCQNNGATTLGYAGAIRQDTSQRKVFYREPSSMADTLLCHFNLSVGDTIPNNWYIYRGTFPPNTISSIDSILIGTTYRKRFNIAGADSGHSLIEGIGSTNGLLLPLDQGVEYGSWLYCFTQNGQNLFINPNGFCQSNPLNIPEQKQNYFLETSPNPSTGIFTITSSEKFQFSVYDVFGREVYQSGNPTTQSTTLDLSSYPKGIYFVRVKSNEKYFSRKIILQ